MTFPKPVYWMITRDQAEPFEAPDSKWQGLSCDLPRGDMEACACGERLCL